MLEGFVMVSRISWMRSGWMVSVALAPLVMSLPAHAERFSPGLEGRVTQMEQKLERLNRTPVNSGSSANTSAQVEISRMQEELRSIRGGIEENRFALEQLQREMKLNNEDYDYRIRELEQKAGGGMAAIPNALGETPKAPDVNAQAMSTPAPLPTPVVPKVIAPTPPIAAPVLPSTPSAGGFDMSMKQAPVPLPAAAPTHSASGNLVFSDPAEHYNYAVSLVKNKQYPEARDSFQKFVGNNKGHKLVGNAYYWLGETYYVGSDFVAAADTFRQGFEANPEGVKAPDNLYKLSKSLLHLQKKQEACVVLSQIQKRYKTRNPEVVGLAFETQKANGC
jgi:tol-pal system protein YbgF